MEKKRFSFCLVVLLAGFIGLSLSMGAIPAYAQAQKTSIDLNTASQKDLESLKGVGPATAKKIIEGRPYKTVDDLKKAGVSEKTIGSIKPLVKVGAAAEPSKPTAAPKPTPAAKPSKTAAEAKPAVTPASTKAATDTKPTAATPAEKPKAKAAAQAPAKLTPGQKVNLNTATKEQLDALPEIGPVKAQAIIDGRPYKKIEDVMKVKGIKEGIFNKIKDSITVQ
jgi:competence protein ComEA